MVGQVLTYSKTGHSGHLYWASNPFSASLHSVPEKGNCMKIHLYWASTWLKQAHSDYPIGACLIQVGLYFRLSMLCKNSAAKTIWFEPAQDKIYNKTCVTSKDSNQPVPPRSMARVLIYPSLDFVLCWGFTAQSTQWGHVERGQFT